MSRPSRKSESGADVDTSVLRAVERMIAPVVRKLRLSISRAVLKLVQDGAGIQSVQVSLLDGEVTDSDVEHMQPGGLTHVALPGAEGVYLAVGAVREDGVVIGLANRDKRPKGMQAGETAVYSAGTQQSRILLKADGSVEILAATSVLIGDGAAEAFVKGNALQTWVGAMTVGTPMGPSTPPLNAAAFPSCLSTKHKLDG